MPSEFPLGFLFKKPTVFGRDPASFDQQIGERLRLVTRPGTTGSRELLQVNQVVFKRQNGKQQVLFNGHAGQRFPQEAIGSRQASAHHEIR